jgi:hypothetical protein
MTETIQTTPAPIGANEPIAASANPAVARCMSAWKCAYKTEFAKCKDEYDASEVAQKAYRDAMPQLSGYDNIRDFIACVVNAMLIGAIEDNQGTKLLYGASSALVILSEDGIEFIFVSIAIANSAKNL